MRKYGMAGEIEELKRRLAEAAGELAELRAGRERHAAAIDAVRRMEERQAFLLKLSDALRPLADPVAIEAAAARVTMDHLAADRCYYCTIDNNLIHVLRDASREGLSSAVGAYPLDSFPIFKKVIEQGRPLIVDDSRVAETLDDVLRAICLGLEILSFIDIPVIKDGKAVGIFALAQSTPRTWSNTDVALLEDVAERTWAAIERARAETALRENRERLALSVEIGNIGHWDLDLNTGEMTTSVHCRRNFGRPEDVPFTYDELVASIHPDDREHQRRAVEAAIATQTGFTVEYRLIDPQQRLRWAQIQGRYVRGDVPRLIGVSQDITEQKRAELARKESEERQAFLLKLSDELRPLIDPVDIQNVAARILGEHLGADRTYYAVVHGDYDFVAIERDYIRGDAPSVVGRHDLADFGSVLQSYRLGRNVVLDDVEAPDAVPASDLPGFRALEIRALVSVPLFKRGRTVASMTVLKQTPHRWTSGEISLVEEAAERSWAALERAVAATALRESEARFQQFAVASSRALWIRDADSLKMEYVSPAIAAIYGVGPDDLLDGLEAWAVHVVPEDRNIALEHFARAQQGEAVIHEFRIQRASDRVFRWVRDTAFPLLDAEGRIQRVGGIGEDITEAKLAADHQRILLAELEHRTRNIMAIIRSIATRTAEGAGSVADYEARMSGRLMALARVQALLTRAANAGVGIKALVQAEISAQADHDGQYVLEGPDVELSPKAAEVLTLAVHELATNALKYGALSGQEGKVSVTWRTMEKRGDAWLAFDWAEEGAPGRTSSSGSQRRGFGSELIEARIPYELRGTGRIEIGPGGAKCHIEFPLVAGPSVLETGAPQPASVFGGALDMSGEPDLSHKRVLVLEDDYYLASDAARALRGAGAVVLGPSANEDDARAQLAAQLPDAAIVDINLGAGPSFKLAEALKGKGVPFVFITGYDQGSIPPEFASVGRLEKPVQLRQIVDAVAKLVGSG